jgi:CheY-like chemotaxis protein
LPNVRMDTLSPGATVILADDDDDVVESLAALLRFELPQVDVVVTHDGFEAVDAALLAPAALAIVLDMDMPRMTGLKAAETLRRKAPCANPTVLVAVSGDQNLLDEAGRSGYFQMIQRKPINFQSLLRLLKSC